MQPTLASRTSPQERTILQGLKACSNIQEAVERQAAERPDAIAVVSGEEQLTYAELNGRANQVAHALRSMGVRKEGFVGIYMERTARTVVAILGILKAGGCYVPIDLVYPKERAEFILRDSEASVVITETEHSANLSDFSGRVLCLDADYAAVNEEPAENLASGVGRENAAYVIFTSGSTGQPKGVAVTHHNVLRLFEATDHWYGFTHEDVWTIFHSFAFDFSVWELWGGLFYGGTVIVVPHAISRNPAAFYELLGREGVTVLNQTPSAFRQLMWAEENAPEKQQLRLRYVIFGGEALELQSLRAWFDRHSPEAPLLVNMYGITETTVHVTYRPIYPHDIEENCGSVIGEPIPDLTIRLLDEDGNEVPVGTPGEIYVGGEGVARGYLKRPELNAQKFIVDRFSATPGARLYRSGDLAKRLLNGDLEYLGRIDHQVKIHGFRIELGEIEAVLNSHPEIRESVVLCDESTGDKRLVAYVVGRDQLPSLAELREFASRRLPAYMVPVRVISLDALPLTVNGKVDRRALPAPDGSRPALATSYAEPSTPEEKTLAQIWQKVLGIDKVGVNDNFFELGGDSIRSIQVLAQAQQNGINFSLQKLFQNPTISALSRNLDSEGDDKIDRSVTPFALINEADRAKAPASAEDAYPIGRLQHGMIFHSDLDKESAIFHDVFSFRFKLAYSRARLEQAVERLTQRHTIFRTSFHLEGFSEPMQVLHRSVRMPFTEEDLRERSESEQREILIAWVEREKRNRFRWDEAPLMRLHVQQYGEESFQFIVSFHHAIMDGWSLAMMLTELFQDYVELLGGNESGIKAPQVTYRDFVVLEQETARADKSQKFWRENMKDAVLHTLPRWPHKPDTVAHEQTRGPEIYYPGTLLRALQEVARSCGVPIRTVLLAAHCRVMKLLTGYSDITTGLVANGRPQCVDGERLIGLFLNTLPFRVQVENQSWKELIKATFAAEQELIPHRRMPLSDIQQLAGGQTLFETTFDFVQFHIYRDLPGYKDHSFLEDHYFEANNFNFFVTFMLDALASELQMHFDYNPNEFSAEQIKAICDYYTETLRAMAAAPENQCEVASLLPTDERHKVLKDWNATEQQIPNQFVQEIFEERAVRAPDATAVVFGNQRLSYVELNKRATTLAAELQSRGVKPDTLVGVYIERSPEMVISILGVLKAGGAYVPLDPNYPKERLAFMVKDSGLRIIVTSSRLAAKAEELGEATTCCVDALAKRGESLKPSGLQENHLAYVIYTSGSTGLPKGVQIPHRALLNFLLSVQKEPGLTAEDRLLAVTTLSFDIAGLELWLPLITGASIVLANADDAKDPTALSRLIDQHDITVMQATPVTWSALLHSGWNGKAHLKALCGGEPMSPQLAHDLCGACAEVWNMYGPTETTIWSTIERVQNRDGVISIGRPIANTEIYILDSHLNPVPVGSDGEIFIGGDGLARGYLNRAELTANKFIADPFKPNARLYRTGDLGHYLPDGRIICLGRSDNQVKVRGFRIELGEIESVLERHPAVRKAVVATQTDESANTELVAFWIPSESGRANETELRRFVQEHLPQYMIPNAWMELKEFPLTPNGKIDRKRLPVVTTRGLVTHEVNRLRPQTTFENEIAETWRTMLRVPEVGITDDFFELGGHSLLAMRLVGSIRTKYKVNITLAKFFQEPTVQALAAHVEKLVKEFAAAQAPAANREMVAV